MAKTILYTGEVFLREGVGEDVYFLALGEGYEPIESFELINLLTPYAFQEAENRYNLDPYEYAYNFYINDVIIYGSISSEDNINIYVGSKTEYTKSLLIIEDDLNYYIETKGFNAGDTVTISVEPVPRAVNKVVYDNNTLIDITDTTAVESDVAEGKTFYKADGKKAVGTGSGGGNIVITNCASLFVGGARLDYLDEIMDLINTNANTSCSAMFNNCSLLTSLDLTNFYTPNVTTMSFMFNGCSNLTSLDLSNFNFSKVTSVTNMFADCSNLVSLIIGTNGTSYSRIGGSNNLFNGCSSLNILTIRGIDVLPLSSSNALINLKADCQIKVPSSLVNSYKKATNWSTRASYISAI